MLDILLNLCYDHLKQQTAVTPHYTHGRLTSLTVNQYTISIQEDEDGDGDEPTSLTKTTTQAKAKLPPNPNHSDILLNCLNALQNLAHNVSTDGDHKDAEAFFYVERFGNVILKVR